MLKIKQKPRLHATWIDSNAIEIIERLQKAGFVAYLVGGCVRDLLAGIHPKDFDIATNAEPDTVKKKVWGSYVIGRRFRLVLAKRNQQQYEIATFRRGSKPEDRAEGEEVPFGDNFFGTEEEDALRRDFTINALFYDPIKDKLIDYANGMKDIDACMIRMIGDPKTRILEDPIRSLRAIRLSHKIKFSIEPEFRRAILETAAETAMTILPRRREEYLKFFRLKDHVPALCEMYDLDLMKYLLPSLNEIWIETEKRNQFIDIMHRMEEITWNYQNPIEIYLPIILAYTQIQKNESQFDEKRDVFMREELGMFKAETADVLQTLDQATGFPPLASFLKRGTRRQNAFLTKPNLEFALRIAKMEALLPFQDLSYWTQALLK